jgi:hypothetical protein
MDNLGIFSAWVGIVAFILAIPISIAANLLTPKVHSWWATTSQRRRERRILYLKAMLGLLSGESPKFSIRFDYLCNALNHLSIAVIACFMLIGLSARDILNLHAHLAGFAPSIGGPEYDLRSYSQDKYLIVAIAMLGYYFFLRAITGFRLATERGLLIKRRQLEEELAKLCGTTES